MTLRLDKLSILVAEDVSPMRHLIVTILETLGVGQIYTAVDGQEAFELFCTEKPDIVITDWHMAGKDGLDLTREIRKSERSPNKVVPIIMLSGYNARSRIIASRDIGATEYLVKPFTADHLIKRILHVIENPRDFIMNQNYFGPDRRRKDAVNYNGPFRRAYDNQPDRSRRTG